MVRERSDIGAKLNDHQVKRVSVRSGGAGHAHSGIIKTSSVTYHASSIERESPSKRVATKIVRLGR
jgi:hypothetical protein